MLQAALSSHNRIAALTETIRRHAPDTPIFTADLYPVGLRDIRTGEPLPLSAIDGQRVVAFSALGNPATFESMVGELGGVLAKRHRFRDHHAVTQSELAGMYAQALQVSAAALVTTEKDAVKLPDLATDIPIWTIQVEMRLNEPEAFYALLSRLCFFSP